jgi:outer membrane lipoprotein-sorting protein
MTVSPRTRRRAAWSAPVLTLAVVTGVAAWPGSASASDHPNLPARSAAQLLADVQSSSVRHLSGTVVETARLGLPSLPGTDNAAALSWQTLVAGSHTARVWVDGADRQRVALLGQLTESDVVHNGNDVWTYASDTQQVGHSTLSSSATTAAKDKAQAKAGDLGNYTPLGAADQALKAIDPTTVVSVDRTARVAGRPAYTLTLSPRTSGSTVHKVAIAIDAANKVPLRVQVFGSGSQPAFEIGFTRISFGTPSAKVFSFTPPRGSVVSKDLLPLLSGQADQADKATSSHASTPSTRTVGSGWTSVLVASGGAGLPGLSAHGNSVVDKLFVTQPNGSRLLQTALVNVLMTPDGRVLVGAVSPAVLQQAAG